MTARRRRGARAYLSGLAAEEGVTRHYGRRGHVLARRWRGTGGEIDVIARDGEDTVFVEVKSSSTHARAAEALGRRQTRRIFAAATEYMATLPDGLASCVRFDVALVDALGRIEVIENAIAPETGWV
jgi:putative endonuclease